MNKNYNLKLDLQFRCNNSIMKFNQFDNNTSDFFMRITNGGNLVDIEKAIVVLAIIKPSGKIASQFVEVKNGLVYVDLKPSMKDEIGTYTAQAMLILEDERVVTNVISYEVEEDKIFSLLNDTVEATEEFTLLTDMLSRLSTIETSEEQRVINEAERILSEENRKIEESKRVEAELIRQHEEADRAKYDATRESNENIRKQNESTRLANETNRIDEEAKRVEEETKRVEAEKLRKDNYNFMTEDEERRRLEANAHKEAEVLRVQAETIRVNEEAKRRTTEQGRVLAENTRVSNEGTRETNEETRQTNETHRVEAETQRQNRYNSFILEAEANASNFENYTNSAKVKEEERKSNELNRKSQEDRRVSNEVERISNENARKANEVAREKNETSRQNIFENKVDEVDKKIVEINTTKDNFVSNINTKVDTKISELNTTKDNFVSSVNTKVDSKISELDNTKSDMATSINNKVNEVENRFNALTSKQQQDAEVIDARDGETSLKARLDRDIEKAKQVYVDVEGSHISSDSSVGYAKDVEILGNTVQSASNLADIRSVGDKVEGQELYEIPVLSTNKNIFSSTLEVGDISDTNGIYQTYDASVVRSKEFIKVKPNTTYCFSVVLSDISSFDTLYEYGRDKKFIKKVVKNNGMFTTSENAGYISFKIQNRLNIDAKVQIEEGTQATPYEPYKEDKLTILSPVQLEKVGDVRDRIIEKDGVWGVEKWIDVYNFEDISSFGVRSASDSMSTFEFNIPVVVQGNGNTLCICSSILGNTYNNIYNTTNLEGIGVKNYEGRNICRLNILNSRLSSLDKVGFDKFTNENNTKLYFVLNTPQFIPLPHDQQVKLRTFANKTNISFLTEIEGTIKAQVPKSLGATVNTHTEQINSLNKELDRVKKLEESTVSIVTTESDFTTVEATSNGYFEDVKLEGKTLVNLATQPTNNGSINHQYATISTVTNIKPSTVYTYIIRNNGSETLKLYLNTNGGFDWFDLDVEANSTVIGKAKTLPTINGDIWLSLKKAETVEQNLQVVLLEGDHTQNPPSYFEGLKSVGQSATTSEDGVDEIVVSSVKGDGNLFEILEDIQSNSKGLDIKFDKAKQEIKVNGTCTDDIYFYAKSTNIDRFDIKAKNSVCSLSIDICEGTATIGDSNEIMHISIPNNLTGNAINLRVSDKFAKIENVSLGSDFTKSWIRFKKNARFNNCTIRIMLNKGTTPKPYTPHQSDKKRLLYYNEETQTWEKPILREWDSIEKHADGKYYYHKRSEEVVLNGSESWIIDNNNTRFGLYNIDSITGNVNVNVEQISDKFSVYDRYGEKIGSFGVGTGFVRIQNNFGFTTANEFKQWLQANNVTVVYQLAQEKVYECTNIDLITYANETNYVVNSGVIVPKTTLKVHNNISNIVSLLQKKVSLLESNVKASQEVQDMMILETDMRMLDIELALMEFIPMTLNLGGSNMLRSATYFNFLKNHIINETYEKEYLENVMNKYLATGRINQDEYNELYKMLYPPVYDIELPIEY